jgi:hypothetical protein
MKILTFHLLLRDCSLVEPLIRVSYQRWMDIYGFLRKGIVMHPHMLDPMTREFAAMLDPSVQLLSLPRELFATTVWGHKLSIKAESEQHKSTRPDNKSVALAFSIDLGALPAHATLTAFRTGLMVSLGHVRPRLVIGVDGDYFVPAYAMAAALVYANGGDTAFAQEIIAHAVTHDDGNVELA